MKTKKIRAWDEQFKIMRYDYKIGFHPEQKIEYGLIGNFEPFVGRWESEKKFVYFPLMQYTGLEDKNGKDIYEGDLLKEDNERQNIYKVFYVGGGFGINTFQDEIKNPVFYESMGDMQNSGYIQQSLSIVGNIYENPELLTN